MAIAPIAELRTVDWTVQEFYPARAAWQSWVRSDAKLSMTARCVAFEISDRMGPDNNGSWPSQKFIGARLGCKERTVREAISEPACARCRALRPTKAPHMPPWGSAATIGRLSWALSSHTARRRLPLGRSRSKRSLSLSRLRRAESGPGRVFVMSNDVDGLAAFSRLADAARGAVRHSSIIFAMAASDVYSRFPMIQVSRRPLSRSARSVRTVIVPSGKARPAAALSVSGASRST